IVIPPAIFFYYSTLFDSRFKTLQQNQQIKLSSGQIAKVMPTKSKYQNILIVELDGVLRII
ncbi:hypothetical protein P7H98_12290, partial [Lactococcus lactis]|uniref:hypothetical protein n=1 Tax=Lactococcus lactis TaxID=1358 RepID=UPI00288C6C02